MASNEIDEFFVLDNGPSTSKQSVNQIANPLGTQSLNQAGEDVEYVEENIVAEIIQLDDGEFYVAVPEDAQDFDIDTFNNIQIVVNDDGTETLIFENEPEQEAGEAQNRTQFPDSTYDEPMMYGNVLTDSGLPLEMGAAESGDEALERENYGEMIPGGMKHRRNRVYGQCRCPDCGQSFVNTARLERHLAVHQIFGSFLCPLCGKTYKYEYNLFYHWRKTCRDMNELLKPEDRKTIEVNMLRQLVEEIAQKKAAIGSIELGISGHHLYRDTHLEKLDNPPSAVFGRRGAQCKACNVLTLAAHMPRHMAVHRGEYAVDERSIGGGYFCDLCGLMFRLHSNLIKHWRTSCPEIQANLPEDEDLALDDAALKEMVGNLLKRSVVNDMDLEDPGLAEIDRDPSLASARPTRQHPDAEKAKQLDNLTADLGDTDIRDDDLGGSSMRDKYRQNGEQGERFDTRWADEQGIVFADDFIDDDEAMLIDEHGNVGALPMSAHSRAKWTISGMPVQCTECFRTFANAGRLERHLAGFHASYGSHHCVLCGNRFKYDYNLLYHYRRSCPYTKAFIERDVREQLDATNLRKLVRTLAQKEVRLAPQLTNPISQKFHKRDFGDSFVRRQMLKSILPTNTQSPTIRPPPAVMQQPPRPGLPNGRECPVCSVVFYGAPVIEKHMKVAHPHEYQSWDPDMIGDMEYENREKDIGRSRRYKDDFHEELEPPPALEPVMPGEVEEPPPQANVRHQIVDEHGNVITEVADLSEVQRLIESGQLEVRDGDQIVIMDQEGNYGENAFQFMGEGMEPYYEQEPHHPPQIIQQGGPVSQSYEHEEGVPEVRRSPRRSTTTRPTPAVLAPGKRGARGKKRPHEEEFEGEEVVQNQSQGSTEGLEVAQILSGMAQEQATPGSSQQQPGGTPLRRSTRRREVSMRSE